MNEPTHRILEKGLNFIVVPRKIPVEEILCNIKTTLSSMTEENTEAVRQECALVLRTTKPPNNNLSKDEREALWEFKNNNDIKILKADKGNSTVILDKTDYHNKMIEHMTSESYRVINKYPGNKIMATKTKAIKISSLDDSIEKVTPNNAIMP